MDFGFFLGAEPHGLHLLTVRSPAAGACRVGVVLGLLRPAAQLFSQCWVNRLGYGYLLGTSHTIGVAVKSAGSTFWGGGGTSTTSGSFSYDSGYNVVNAMVKPNQGALHELHMLCGWEVLHHRLQLSVIRVRRSLLHPGGSHKLHHLQYRLCGPFVLKEDLCECHNIGWCRYAIR